MISIIAMKRPFIHSNRIVPHQAVPWRGYVVIILLTVQTQSLGTFVEVLMGTGVSSVCSAGESTSRRELDKIGSFDDIGRLSLGKLQGGGCEGWTGECSDSCKCEMHRDERWHLWDAAAGWTWHPSRQADKLRQTSLYSLHVEYSNRDCGPWLHSRLTGDYSASEKRNTCRHHAG